MKLGILRTAVRMMKQHIDDIRNGLAEGLYEPEENKDLPAKCRALDAMLSSYMSDVCEQEAWRVDDTIVKDHCLGGQFYIHQKARAEVQAIGLEKVMRWFNQPQHPGVLVGDVRQIPGTALEVYFGFNEALPNGQCFFCLVLPVGLDVPVDDGTLARLETSLTWAQPGTLH